MIVLTSDNGPEPGAGSAGTFKGTKGSLYEGGIREPFIVWCPAKIAVNKTGTVDSKNVIAGMDLPPSFARLAGVDPRKIAFDGKDMSEALVGKQEVARKREIMWQRPPDRKMIEGTAQPDVAIRQGDLKLLMNTDGSSVELYDLSEDPEESKNLSGERPETVKKLSDKLLTWRAAMP